MSWDWLGDSVFFGERQDMAACGLDGHKPAPENESDRQCRCRCGMRIYYKDLPTSTLGQEIICENIMDKKDDEAH